MDINLAKQINLRKKIVFDLKKKIGLENQKAQVVLCLDNSGSMDHLFRNGKVQTLIERLIPLGLTFDDNGEVDFYLFSTNYNKIGETLTTSNLQGYINNKIYGKYNMGGTNYAPVIKAITEEMCAHNHSIVENVLEKAIGFMSGLFGKKKTEVSVKTNNPQEPIYVIFVTDGDNSDHEETKKEVIKASHYGIFFQFVGIGSSSFNFLNELDTMEGRFIDNANFFSCNNIESETDDSLYAKLLGEFPSWITLARNKGLIK